MAQKSYSQGSVRSEAQPGDRRGRNLRGDSPSKVLFLIIYDTQIQKVTNEDLYGAFSYYGKIYKILIFSRRPECKAFIEFFSLEDSTRAKEGLDSKKLFADHCKMNIYYSANPTIEMEGRPTQGKIYSSQNFLSTYHEAEEGDFKVEPREYALEKKKSFTSPSAACHFGDKDDQFFSSEIDKLMDEEELETKISTTKAQAQAREPTASQDVPCSLAFDDNLQYLSLDFYFNIFSNFGNITRIVRKHEEGCVIVQFVNEAYCRMAYKYLEKLSLDQRPIRLRFSYDREIEVPDAYKTEKIIYSERCYRMSSISINPPTCVLHISGIDKDALREKYLFDYFGKYGDVEKVRVVQGESKAFAQFASVEEAATAMGHLHGKRLMKKRLQVSFTKTVID